MTPQQIETNYIESFQYLQARKTRQVQQLVLLNNLQRGDQNIASTLLLTLFNRLMSTLYDDKIQVKFLPTQGIMQEQLNSYNLLSQSDYLEMGKAKLDYDWIWDTLFFGRGYMETYKFNLKKKIMEPQVINPLVFGYDPYFENVQDWRYYWKWVTKSKWDLQKLIKDGTITGVTKVEDITSGIDPFLWNYKSKRDIAKKAVEPPIAPAQNDVYQILEYFGYDDEGNKCIYWIDKNFSTILFKDKLDFNDDDNDENASKWPIVVKETFREPHSSINFSVADLLEDKHRAKSVLLNLAYIAAKDKANPIYGYNPDKVRDVSQFFSRQINQHIPMDSADAAWPLNIEEPMSAGLLQFIRILDGEAEQPVGAGRPMQAMGAGNRATATEAALDQQLNDLAQSLQAKLMQFGEAEFWSAWFHRYAKYADELKEKMANVVGVKGVTSEIIDFKDFKTDYPPQVMVYSAKEAEYKETVLRRDLMQLYPDFAQTLGPDGMRNFNKFVFFPKFLQDPSLIDIMLPKTLDEIKAEGENEQLKKDVMPQVQETDNHSTHLYTHQMVQPKTWATWMHMSWHEELLAKQTEAKQMQEGGQVGGQSKVSESISYKDLPPDGQKQMAAQAGIKIDNPQPVAPGQPGAQPNQPLNKINVGADKRNPIGAAVPLKQEMNPKTVIR